MKKTGKQNIRWNTMKILAVGFLSVIFLGAVLLWLPVSNEKSISFLDALFTSTSSVCVTGLVTIVPKYQFTITGMLCRGGGDIDKAKPIINGQHLYSRVLIKKTHKQ